MDNTVLYDLSYGMYAVGVKDGMRECGCIVNTVFQVSTIGPLIALSMNKDNYTCSLIEKSKCFSLSILPETIDSQVISDLGFQTGKDKDKWVKLNHHLFRELPVVDDALGYMMCEVQSQMDAGTHFVFLAKVVDAKHDIVFLHSHNVKPLFNCCVRIKYRANSIHTREAVIRLYHLSNNISRSIRR